MPFTDHSKKWLRGFLHAGCRQGVLHMVAYAYHANIQLYSVRVGRLLLEVLNETLSLCHSAKTWTWKQQWKAWCWAEPASSIPNTKLRNPLSASLNRGHVVDLFPQTAYLGFLAVVPLVVLPTEAGGRKCVQGPEDCPLRARRTAVKYGGCSTSGRCLASGMVSWRGRGERSRGSTASGAAGQSSATLLNAGGTTTHEGIILCRLTRERD